LRNANQKIKNLQRKLFAPKSEKITAEQLPFFELESCFSAKNNSPVNTAPETVMVPVKKKRHRKRSDSFSTDLPTEIIVNKLTDQACRLDSSHKTTKVGLKHVRDEIKFIPAQVKIVKYYQETYQCLTCSKLAGKNVFYYQDMARALFSHSYATPSLVAHVIHLKYELGVPLYRQLKDWHNIGITVSEPTLANWVIKGAQLLEPFVKRMKQVLFSQRYLQGDETPLTVLKEPNKKATSKSYIWLTRSIKICPQPVIYYSYSTTRSGTFACNLYQNFAGVLQTDGYQAYGQIPQVSHVGCWAHCRRYFFEAAQVDGKTVLSEPLKLLNKMFSYEAAWKKLSPRARKRRRRSKMKRLLNKFWYYVEHTNALPKGKLGKAITYAKNQKKCLNQLLDFGTMEWSNNASERNIKSVVIGRKNWLFANSQAGAKASATWYTIVETAKANGLKVEEYITALLAAFSQIEELSPSQELLDSYLPWNWKKDHSQDARTTKSEVSSNSKSA